LMFLRTDVADLQGPLLLLTIFPFFPSSQRFLTAEWLVKLGSILHLSFSRQGVLKQ